MHWAAGYFSTSCSMAWLSSAMLGSSRSSNSKRSRRRRLAHGANCNASNCFRPFSRHNHFLQRRPSLRATTCSRFMIRVRACPSGADAITVAGDPGFPNSAPIYGKRSSSSKLNGVSDSRQHQGNCGIPVPAVTIGRVSPQPYHRPVDGGELIPYQHSGFGIGVRCIRECSTN